MSDSAWNRLGAAQKFASAKERLDARIERAVSRSIEDRKRELAELEPYFAQLRRAREEQGERTS